MYTNQYYQMISKIFYILLVVSIVLIIPNLTAFATATAKTQTQTSGNAISKVICNVVKQLTGPIGQAVSTIAVIFIGIGLFMGKISWGLALGIAVGMAMLFGAENVVGWVSQDPFTCTTGKAAP